MKKYFTKYLPVEGEIKEGDLVQLDKRLVNYTTKWQKKFREKNSKKAKLFLCSRDIQIGDKEIVDQFTGYTNLEMIGIDESWIVPKGWVMKKKNGKTYTTNGTIPSVYKIIGEISPKSIWIQEGMEFDENELRKLITVECYYQRMEQQYNVKLC